MGTLLSSTVLKSHRIRFKVILDEEEAASLRGSMKNVHIFTEELCFEEAHIVEKGVGGVTKYFLLPKKFTSLKKKSKKELNAKRMLCQSLDVGSKIFFIYTIDRGEV